jgi:hypothetical protein
VIFPYLALPTKAPVVALGGAMVRYRPIFTVGVSGTLGARLIDACVDCGCDDTIFPLSLARKLGIDLTGAPQGEAKPHRRRDRSLFLRQRDAARERRL